MSSHTSSKPDRLEGYRLVIVMFVLAALIPCSNLAAYDFRSARTILPLIREYSTWPTPTTINVCFSATTRAKAEFTAVPSFVPAVGEGVGWFDWFHDAIMDTWGRVADLQIQIFNSPCPGSTGGWVVVHINENNGEWASPGYLGSGTTHSIYLNWNEGQGTPPSGFNHHACGYAAGQPKPISGTYDSYEEFRHDAIHEFGHILGFGHNMDDPNRATYAAMPGGPSQCKGSTVSAEDLNPGEWDFASIMEYCSAPCRGDHWGSSRPYSVARLSDYDVWGAQKKYGRKGNGTVIEVVGHRNTRVDVPGGSAVSGRNLQVWEYNRGTNQVWDSVTDYVLRTPLLTSLVWDVEGGTTKPSSGTPVQLYEANGGAWQQFKLVSVEWRGAGNSCLTASSASAGAFINLERCRGAANQKWKLNMGATYIQAQLAGTSLCVASPTTFPSSGFDMVLESCSTAGARSWFDVSGRRGQMKFYYDSTLCLDTEWGDPAGPLSSSLPGTAPRSLDTYSTAYYPVRSGRRLQVYTCKAISSDSLNQQFHARGPIVGLDGQCLDIAGGKGVDGAALQVHPCNGGRNQQWDYYFN